jgi:hypothetical protein
MERYVTDERTELKNELIGDYYFFAGDDEPEDAKAIGVWIQRMNNIRNAAKEVVLNELIYE